MTLEELVNSKLDKLNPTDLIVWRYIYAHKKECCYISIYDIADNCNVSRTTVLRFAKKLGLDGFSDLKMMLKMEISQAREKPSMDIAEATVNLCKNVGEEIAKQDFTRLNKLLHNAKRIFVYASGHVQKNVASEISRLFVNCNVLVYEIKGPDEIGIILKNITENDLFIIISLTLATLSTENIYVTPIDLPATVDFEYKSMLGFFLAVEMWFVSYSQYCAEQIE